MLHTALILHFTDNVTIYVYINFHQIHDYYALMITNWEHDVKSFKLNMSYLPLRKLENY